MGAAERIEVVGTQGEIVWVEQATAAAKTIRIAVAYRSGDSIVFTASDARQLGRLLIEAADRIDPP